MGGASIGKNDAEALNLEVRLGRKIHKTEEGLRLENIKVSTCGQD